MTDRPKSICPRCDACRQYEDEIKGKIISQLLELARLGALLQDNNDRRNVLNQFADLIQYHLPRPICTICGVELSSDFRCPNEGEHAAQEEIAGRIA